MLKQEAGVTASLCPVCLRRLPAKRIIEGNDVFLAKTCPEHGRFQTVIWRGNPSFTAWADMQAASGPVSSVSPECPFVCGLCPDHRQQSCCVLLNVTERCNLACPVCFADAGAQTVDPAFCEIEDWYRLLLAKGGPFNIQLSGGEPTMRDDLPAIIGLGRRMGFDFIQLNTNGIRLAGEAGYAKQLKEAGLACVFLQFDGTNDAIYRRLRGTSLWDVKQEAVKCCEAAGLGVVLTPTLVPGVNIADIGSIIRFAVRYLPTVRGVHFQPVSYFGRYENIPGNSDRVTVPEVLQAIEHQTGGLAKADDFRPACGIAAYCSFHADYLIAPSGEWQPSSAVCSSRTGCCGSEAAKQAREFVARRWRAPAADEAAENDHEDYGSVDSLDQFLAAVNQRSFFLSGMAFQDVWTLDLERLQACFVHVVSLDGRLIPFCAYQATSRDGRRLYPVRAGRP